MTFCCSHHTCLPYLLYIFQTCKRAMEMEGTVGSSVEISSSHGLPALQQLKTLSVGISPPIKFSSAMYFFRYFGCHWLWTLLGVREKLRVPKSEAFSPYLVIILQELSMVGFSLPCFHSHRLQGSTHTKFNSLYYV